MATINPAAVKAWLLDLQARIVQALEDVDGKAFLRDTWQRAEGGGGVSRLIEGGNVIERGGVNFSHVRGASLPASAMAVKMRSWRKVNHPVFESTTEIFGVGHCSFPELPDGRQEFIAYHSKIEREEGWRRVVRLQRFRWTEDNFPDFGKPLATAPTLPTTRTAAVAR